MTDAFATDLTLESGSKPGVDQTRLRILAATRQLYAEKGSRGTTTREVAEQASVNEATLFRHFGTKQQLIAAMLDHYSEASSIPGAIEGARRMGSLQAQLEFLGHRAIESLRRKEDLIRVSMAEELINPDGTLCAWRAPTEARKALCGFMRDKVEAHELRGDPETLARTFMSLFFAYVMANKIWAQDEYPPERVVPAFIDVFVNGAGGR